MADAVIPTMSIHCDDDQWTEGGRNILAPDRLAAIRDCLENRGAIIVEHWLYRMGRSPDRLVFDDYEKFRAYLEEHAREGDSLYVWDYSATCRDDNPLVDGKYPDREGRVPLRGAY
jgi:hypothetical protein